MPEALVFLFNLGPPPPTPPAIEEMERRLPEMAARADAETEKHIRTLKVRSDVIGRFGGVCDLIRDGDGQ